MRTRTSKTGNPWHFFVLAFGISWFFWMWFILLNWGVFTFHAILLGVSCLLVSTYAEIILIYRTHDKEKWKVYWQHIFDIRQIGRCWYVIIMLTFPVLNAISILVSILTGFSLPEFETDKNLLNHPWRIFSTYFLCFGLCPIT